MNRDREQLTPEEREEMRRSNVNRKRRNDAKFSTVADMRKQLNAFKVLHNAGYDEHALRTIASQFEDSKKYAMQQIEDMSNEMYRMSQD
jgi:hypothetical protein